MLFAGRVQALKAPDVLVSALGVLKATGRPVPLLVVLGRSVGPVQRGPRAAGARVDDGRRRRRGRAPAGRPRRPRALVPRGRRRGDAVAQRVVRARRRRGAGQRCPGDRRVRRAGCARSSTTTCPAGWSAGTTRPCGPTCSPTCWPRRTTARAYAVGARRWPSGSAGRPPPTRCSRCTRWPARSGRPGSDGPDVPGRRAACGRMSHHDLHPRAAPPRRERVECQEPVHRLGRRAPVGEGRRGGQARRDAAHGRGRAARRRAHVAAAPRDHDGQPRARRRRPPLDPGQARRGA